MWPQYADFLVNRNSQTVTLLGDITDGQLDGYKLDTLHFVLFM